MKKIKILGAIIVILTILTLWQSNHNLKYENDRVTHNVEQLTTLLEDTVNTFKVNDSINAIKVIKLQYKLTDIEQSSIIDKNIIHDLGIKIKQISAYGHTETVTIYNDTILLRDTVMLMDNVPMAFRTFNETTKWHTINGVILPNKVIIRSFNKEELEYIEHWSKKKFLFIPYGKKRDSQIILSKNPNTQITKSIFITKSD